MSVAPNLKRAECRFGRIWKNGLTEEPPPRAAIHLEPQANGLWMVRGEGLFESLRFSVDTSAEMAETSALDGQMGKDSEAGPAVEIVVQFGPETEVTLNDIDDYRGSELLDLDAAKTLNLNRDFEKWPRQQQTQWLKDNGVDFMLDYVNRQWGLITPWGLESKLVAVANSLWYGMSAEQFERELSRTDPGVKKISRRDVTVYLLETNAAPPLTFAFQTASGARGLLRITRFMEQPNSVRLQFKRGPSIKTGEGLSSPEVTESPQLRAAKAQLRELRARYTDQHPLVREVLKRITVLEQQSDQTHHSSAFGPAIERVLPDPDNGSGRSNRETLHLQTGERASALDGAPKASGGRLRALVASEGDLFAEYDDFVSGRWAFVTAGLKLSDFLSRQWETATSGDMGEALKQPSALQRVEHFGATLYYLPDGLLPLTFAFESRTAERGLLQITGFADNPRTVTIRYKLEQTTTNQ